MMMSERRGFRGALGRLGATAACAVLLLSGQVYAEDPALPELPDTMNPHGEDEAAILTLDVPAPEPEKPRPDVAIESLQLDKVVYRFQAPVSITVAMRNAAGSKQVAKLKIELFHGLNVLPALMEKDIEFAAGHTTQALVCAFVTGTRDQGAEYGYEVRATVTDSKGRKAVAREYFMVTDNPLKIGHLTIPFGMMAPEHPDANYKSSLEDMQAMSGMRAMCFCMAEAPFWAPSDWSELTTTRDIWFSGQAARYISQTGIKANVKGVHDLGGWVVFYAAKWASGAAGFEFARRRPEWFSWDYDWYGCKFDLAELEWKAGSPRVDGKWVKTGGEGTLPAILPLIGRPEVAEYGIRQIAESVRQFDWDGIRLDSYGWYVERDVVDLAGRRALPAGTDTSKLEADLVGKIVAAGREVQPHFVYGVNAGWYTNLAQANPKWLAEAASGGLLMDEGMNGRTLSGKGLPWPEVRTYLRDAIPTVRKAGGYPYGIVGIEGGGSVSEPGPPVGESCVFLATLLAAGMHLCYGVNPGYYPYMRLYARHCDLLYDAAMEFVAEPEPLLAVTGSRPVWWKEYARRRDLPAGMTQFIVHLVNPSQGEIYDAKRNGPPLPQKDVRVVLTPPPGHRIERAFRITADGLDGPDVLALPVAAGDGKATVTVPELLFWDIVVFEGGRQ